MSLRLRFALALGLVLTSGVRPWPTAEAASGAVESACPRATFVALVGSACRLPNGQLEVRLAGSETRTTHGVDRLESDIHSPPDWDAVAPPCVTDTAREHHGLLIYARPADRPDRFAELEQELEDMAAFANGLLVREAAEFDRSVQYRLACDGDGSVRVDTVDLSVPVGLNLHFSSVVSDLQAAGYTSPLAKYWVWVDTGYPFGGVGDFEDDSRPTPSNANNRGPSYGVTWGVRLNEGGASVLVHENGHNLGAVVTTAPNTSGEAHCNDGLDVMCYADGGPFSQYDPDVCARLHFDCGHDDYFHPDPSPASYLGRFWNLASPFNRFVQGCVYRSGSLTLLGTDTVAVPPQCGGRPYAVSSTVDVARPDLSGVQLLGPFDRALPDTVSADTPVFDVCWYRAASLLRCDPGAVSYASARVPRGADSARVTLRTGSDTPYVFSII